MTIMPPNPGPELRQIIKESGLGIGEAAQLLDVSRQALSHLLNGKAMLSNEMGQRFAKAFPASAEKVLALQEAQEQAQNRKQAKEIMVRTHVPHFLGITADQIQAWADGIPARSQLAALLRRLVHGAGAPLTKVDFPAFDNSQRPGWDGQVVAEAASPWFPLGRSGWEFGCDKKMAQKAEDDYQARTAGTVPSDGDDPADTTFVFVTPRKWPGKDKWAKEKSADGVWKDVRALDASDLEQWLEQCPAAQAWFGELIGARLPGIKSLDVAWTEWANTTRSPLPPLSKTLFRSAVETKAGRIAEWLKQPPSAPLVVAADSDEEAIAFLVCALEHLGQPAGKDFDGALIVDSADAVRRVSALGANLILVTASSEVEAAYPSLARPQHLIIAARRNSLRQEADVTLDLVDTETFNAALEAMGIEHPEQQHYSAATANSPTILRRYLANSPSLRSPSWSTDPTLARKLIPLMFTGVWSTEMPADIEVMKCLTGESDATKIERTVAELGAVKDSPTWSVGKFRGVTSKIDTLFAAQLFVTQDDLKNFLLVAQIVLSEDDPALDLPEEDRWKAAIHGKTRQHSSALRRGLCETLVLLAAHGDALFRKRLNMDIQGEVNRVIHGLLTPLDSRTWSAQRQDLPRYAEAAPDVFLTLLEEDLASSEPKVHALLQPADSTLFGSCPRSGLLWALERLAWNPDNLLRVSKLLARLSAIRITDNWMNKPGASLGAIFRNWMPQTAAPIAQRNDVMETLCRDIPHAGWRVIIDQLGSLHAIGHYSARPEWRRDASGAGQPVKTDAEVIPVARKALQLALAWPNHDQHTFGDLVDHMMFIFPTEQEQIWSMIIAWAQSGIDDTARHQLRERIRERALTRRAQIQGGVPSNIDRAREAYRALTPADIVVQHLWLFEKTWVGEAPDDEEDDEFNFRKHDARVATLRREALTEIWTQAGYDGVLRLSAHGDADRVIGQHLTEVIPETGWLDLVDRLVSQDEPPKTRKIDLMIGGFLWRLEPDQRRALIAALLDRYNRAGNADEAVRLLKAAPFDGTTWAHLDALPAQWQLCYWRETPVQWQDQGGAEMNLLIGILLKVGRPRAAFHAVHMDFDQVETNVLIQLLRALATSEAEEDAFYRIDQYYISEAFKSLKKRSDIDRTELIQLEFLYAEALDRSEYGMPTLEDALANEPQLFIQLVASVYRRKDGGEDPPEWRTGDTERQSRLAMVAYDILRRFSRLPGTKEDGSVDATALRRWIESARSLGQEFGRAEVTDRTIGDMLGRTRVGPDGIWPAQSVREVLEATASLDIASGMRTGRYNSRGVHSRAAGGAQERELSTQYRQWATAVAYQHPFTAKVLMSLAQQYDREAEMHDIDEAVNKRIDY